MKRNITHFIVFYGLERMGTYEMKRSIINFIVFYGSERIGTYETKTKNVWERMSDEPASAQK